MSACGISVNFYIFFYLQFQTHTSHQEAMELAQVIRQTEEVLGQRKEQHIRRQVGDVQSEDSYSMQVERF